MARGAPIKLTKELFDKICSEIATSSKGLSRICKDNRLDSRIFYLRIAEDKDLLQTYTRAREEQADFMADEMIEIADDTSRDTMVKVGKDGEEYEAENTEWVNRSKIKIDVRKFLASKLKPKKYGDKVDVDLTSAGEQIKININIPSAD